MAVPLLDLKAQYAPMRQEIREAIDRVCDSQVLCLGPEVEALEKEVAAYSACRFAIGVSSGTDALLCALMALDIKPGDEVITSPFTFFATAGVISRLNAKPVFVDIDPETFNIDPARIEKAITPKTRAIIPVHLFGQCADMDPIMEIAKRHKLIVIEDAAQAIGAKYKGRPACSLGDIGCLSFYPTKNLGGFGDGGMILSNNEKLAERMKLLRVHGEAPRYYHHFVGGNFRLDAIQGAVLRIKLRYLDAWHQARQKNAAMYDRLFANSAVKTPKIAPYNVSIYNQYCILVDNRDRVCEHLKAKQVGCGIYYPLPLHLQDCFAYLGYKAGDFAVSESVAKRILAIPVYPELTPGQIEEAAKAVLEAV